jgi:hypothetical protein
MAKEKKKKKVSPEFQADESVDQSLNEKEAKPKRELPKDDIKNHAKFDKFKRGE